MDCIFCKIITGELPSSKVYEDEKIIAFLDIRPANKGHTLVLPKKHYENIFEISDASLTDVILTVKKIAIAVNKAVKCDGINIIQNNNRAAGQIIPHIHFHVIPRFENDSNKHHNIKYSAEEMEEIRKKIIENINK